MHDKQHSGRASDAINENSVSAVWFILENDRCVIIPVIQCTLREDYCIDISFASIHTIIHDELKMTKILIQWVPKQLTDEHRKKRMGDALHFLMLSHEIDDDLFLR